MASLFIDLSDFIAKQTNKYTKICLIYAYIITFLFIYIYDVICRYTNKKIIKIQSRSDQIRMCQNNVYNIRNHSVNWASLIHISSGGRMQAYSQLAIIRPILNCSYWLNNEYGNIYHISFNWKKANLFFGGGCVPPPLITLKIVEILGFWPTQIILL